ncbi:hypothetical protein LCGC14_1209830 [marine sediment metagenome]|uniref:Tetratricopeptide repeat protein n=1 Tax=marine sediment metagenome TaxID=412755 RepID=A0A0F9NWS0_9ZZZZ
MSEKQISSLMKKGEKLYKKQKVLGALEIFNNILKISPEFYDALNLKTQILSKLSRPEEFFQASSDLNLLKLRKVGESPADFNSPDDWIEEAMKLINGGQNERAFMFIMQASYISPIVNREGLSSMTHHTNAKIYYYTAIIFFNKQEKYDLAMSLFEIASKLDPNLTIPEKIKNIYNNYLSNRSGQGVKMIVPLNTSNLRALFPYRDTLLVSTEAQAKASKYSTNKENVYVWYTHVLFSDYGLAFICATPVCKQVTGQYIPWPFIDYNKWNYSFNVSKKAGDFVDITLWLFKTQPEEIEGEAHSFFDLFNFESLIKEREEEMVKRTVIKLKSMGYKPSFKEYKKQYENMPKSIWQRSIKTVKLSKN